jgi:hypothetical protein
MAINALSKLLSYSHATLPYSLCVMYKRWRKAEGLDKIDLEDFSSNRFGRIATLAKRFLQHREDLIGFLEQCVDEHSNKLGNPALSLTGSGLLKQSLLRILRRKPMLYKKL